MLCCLGTFAAAHFELLCVVVLSASYSPRYFSGDRERTFLLWVVQARRGCGAESVSELSERVTSHSARPCAGRE